MHKNPPIKTKIIALSQLLREYEPVLVNEKFEGEYQKKGENRFHSESGISWTDLCKQRSELVQVAGEAMIELGQFIREHEELKSQYRELYVDGMESHQFLQSVGINTKSLAQGIETLVNRIRQCYDVLHHIAHNLPAEKAKETATKFLAPVSIIVPMGRDVPADPGTANGAGTETPPAQKPDQAPPPPEGEPPQAPLGGS